MSMNLLIPITLMKSKLIRSLHRASTLNLALLRRQPTLYPIDNNRFYFLSRNYRIFLFHFVFNLIFFCVLVLTRNIRIGFVSQKCPLKKQNEWLTG